jgi:hypothetical protein
MRFIPSAFVFWMAFALADSARAQVDCEHYASDAVKSAMEVRALNCEYDTNHPQWSLDRDGHLRWCRAANEDSVIHEFGHRQMMLKICQRCSPYADQAVEMFNSSNSWDAKCGFSGPDWSANRSDHFKFCVAAHQETTEARTAHRTERLGRCRACKRYADEAIDQVNQRIRTCQTKQSGPAWSTNRMNHYNWCMKLDNLMPTFRERDARQRAVEACGYGGARIRSTEPPLSVATPSRKVDPARPKSESNSTSSAAASRRFDPSRPKSESKNTSSENAVRAANPCQPGKVNDPCKKKTPVLTPGLLEGGGGVGRQGPSAVGSPTGGPGGAAPAGLGDSYRVR